MSNLTCTVRSESEMIALGARIASHLNGGDLLLLHGDLGAGKTTLTRGIVAGLGSSDAVTSPTFTLIHVYAGGRLPIVHVDAYRLTDSGDADHIGLGEYINDPSNIVVVEWPEQIEPFLPSERLEFRVAELETSPEARELTLSLRGSRWRCAMDQLLRAIQGPDTSC